MKWRTIQRRRAVKFENIFRYKTENIKIEELYDLTYTIVCFTLPRLKEFETVITSYPAHLTMEEWKKILNQIIEGFEIVVRNGNSESYNKEEQEKIDLAFDLFFKWFRQLWW